MRLISLGCQLALATAGAFRRRLSIVLFHRVLSASDSLLVHEPDSERFAEQVRWLRDGFTILPLRDAIERLQAGRLPSGALCVTFDDGYRDNALNALPVLQDLGVPATFFVTTKYLDGGMMWNDRAIEAVRHWREDEIDLSAHRLLSPQLDSGRATAMEALLKQMKYLPYAARETLADELFERSGADPVRMMMNETEIRALHVAGMEIGGHTVTHPILSKLSDDDARREIAENKAQLEAIIGTPLVTFAYPNGRPRVDYDARHTALVRECGYRYALTTSPGTATANTSVLQLPRFTPWDRQPSRYFARMLANYFRQPECVAELAAT